MVTEVEYTQTPAGNHLRIEEKPTGPLIVIQDDGTVTVSRGPFDEVGRLFWEAVQLKGKTYRQRVDELEKQLNELQRTVALLSQDPWKDAVSHGRRVWLEIPKSARKSITIGDVHNVLEAVTNIAMRSVQ